MDDNLTEQELQNLRFHVGHIASILDASKREILEAIQKEGFLNRREVNNILFAEDYE